MSARSVAASVVSLALAGCSSGSINLPTAPGGDEPFAPAAATNEPSPITTPNIPELDDGDDPPPDDAPKMPAGTCEDPASLKQLVACITDRMPRSDSDRYAVPSAALMTAWRSVVRSMLEGSCESIKLPTELAGSRVSLFHDWENKRTYCVLREEVDADGDGIVDRGLGTFIVDPAAERELVHSAPHPFTDETTEQQAVTIFRETRSRAFLFTGVHRRASSTKSSCQSDYYVSDAAHESSHLFHAATAELVAFYGTRDWTEFQWHGMAASTCPGVNAYLTYGVAGSPGSSSRLAQLRDAMKSAHPGWAVHTPGTAPCSMGGTTNVQGRLINSVAADRVCGMSTSVSSGRFIHIEQQPGYRDPKDWIEAVAKVFPAAK